MAAVFLTPFSFLFFLFVIEGPTNPGLLPFGITGGILFSTLFAGNGMLNDCAYLRLERQLQTIFVASPVRPFSYLLGMALSELAFAAPAIGLFILILALVHPFGLGTLLVLLGVIGLTWLMATTLGFLISTFFRQLREIWPIGTLIFSTLAILPPIFYPASVIPARWQWAAFLVPSTYASQLARVALGLSFGPPLTPPLLNAPWFYVLGLVGSTALFAGLASALSRWREP